MDQNNEVIETKSCRYVVTDEMLNVNGTLFGGRAMGWMDLLGHEMAIELTGCQTMFTFSADKIKFLKPVFPGETVEVVSEVEEKGAVKLLLRLTVWADPDGEQRRKALTGVFTFIATDDKFRPVRLKYKGEQPVG